MTYQDFVDLKGINIRVRHILDVQQENATKWSMIHFLIFSEDIFEKAISLYDISFSDSYDDESKVKNFARALNDVVHELSPFFE